jgi:hypothetical protein
LAQTSVTAVIDGNTSVQEVSKVFEGLVRLEQAYRIRLSIEPRRGRSSYPRVVRLKVERGDTRRDVAIDLSDQRDLFHGPDLAECDFYFKRSFEPVAVEPLGPELARKVLPFGLNNPAASQRTALRMLSARARTGRNLAELATDARQLFALPAPAAFECAQERPAEPLILFQTRLWPDTSPKIASITAERVELIRALREGLGRRFIGGAIPDAFARARFPDLVTRHPARMRSWPAVVRRCLIAVYSRGLHDSIAFKMSEYLAAGRCIVAQPSDLTLPQTLMSGRNFLPFESPDQCVAQCERLLADPSLQTEMRRNNGDYYRSQVEPAAHLQRIVDLSLSLSSGAAASSR